MTFPKRWNEATYYDNGGVAYKMNRIWWRLDCFNGWFSSISSMYDLMDSIPNQISFQILLSISWWHRQMSTKIMQKDGVLFI